MLSLNWQVLYVIINVLILFAALRLLLFKPVTAILEKRQKAIADDQEGAQAARRDAEEQKAQYEALMAEARLKAAEILENAQKRGEDAYRQRITEAQADAKRCAEQARAQMEMERERLMEGARQEIAALALLAAAKVTGRTMDAAADRAAVDAFLTEAGDL